MALSRRRERKAQRNGTAELEALRPYLGLAREIQHEVSQVAADSGAPVESLVDAIGRIPEAERTRVARSVFDRLPVDQQWMIVAATFDDAELQAALADEHAAQLVRARAAEGRADLVRTARLEQRLDTTTVVAGEVLTIGLFLEREVHAAVGRGAASDAAPRVLTLRRESEVEPGIEPGTGSAPEGPGRFRVLSDAFNPRGGYFVTKAYDQDCWTSERLESHTMVRVGAREDREDGERFRPTLFPGARVDVERVGDHRSPPTRGLLHLGYAVVGDADIFRL